MNKLMLSGVVADKLSRLSSIGELHYLGTDPTSLLSAPVVAIVGTRKPTPYGKQVTEKFATELARAGVLIVSGLAFGVDVTAHKAALQAGGNTIAVLPSGLQSIYPASHTNTAEQITRQGCLLSEYEPDRVPRKVEFLERNRIIAALSDVVLITEAAAKSGSLNTAKHAGAMGIPICAVPGNITNPQSDGTNWLLKNGAHVVTSSDDILKLLNLAPTQMQMNLSGATDLETNLIQVLLEVTPDTTLLSEKLQISTDELLTTLTVLELNGRIYQDVAGNWHIS